MPKKTMVPVVKWATNVALSVGRLSGKENDTNAYVGEWELPSTPSLEEVLGLCFGYVSGFHSEVAVPLGERARF